MGTRFSIRGGMIRYKAVFSGIVVFISAFLLGFCAAVMNNPVGESYAEAYTAIETLRIGPAAELYNAPENGNLVITTTDNVSIYTVFTDYVGTEK